MSRQLSLMDMAQTSGADQRTVVALLTPEDIARRLREIAEGDAAENPWGLRVSRATARWWTHDEGSMSRTSRIPERIATVLCAFLQSPPTAPFTRESALRHRGMQAWIRLSQYLAKRSEYHAPSFAVMDGVLAPIGGWHPAIYQILFGDDAGARADLEARLEAAEAYEADTQNATWVDLKDIEPGDEIVTFAPTYGLLRVIAYSGPHRNDRIGERVPHLDVIAPLEALDPDDETHLYPNAPPPDIVTAVRAIMPRRLLTLWPHWFPGKIAVVSRGADPNALLPTVEEAAETARALVSVFPADTDAALTALDYLEGRLDFSCWRMPQKAAAYEAAQSALADQWQDRLPGLLAEDHPTFGRRTPPEVIQALQPLALRLATLTNPDEILAAIHEHDLLVTAKGYDRPLSTYYHLQGFQTQERILARALANLTEPPDITSILLTMTHLTSGVQERPSLLVAGEVLVQAEPQGHPRRELTRRPGVRRYRVRAA